MTSELPSIIAALRSNDSRRLREVAWKAADLLEAVSPSNAQPFTPGDLAKGEAVVRALHGLHGFDAWAERIAKALAAERK